MEADPAAVRNFKDFLQLYNRMTEMCFQRCVDNLNARHLDQEEIKCVESCSQKFVNYNNKLMQNFVKSQGDIMNKRIKEAEEQQLLDQQRQKEIEKESFALASVNQEVSVSNS